MKHFRHLGRLVASLVICGIAPPAWAQAPRFAGGLAVTPATRAAAPGRWAVDVVYEGGPTVFAEVDHRALVRLATPVDGARLFKELGLSGRALLAGWWLVDGPSSLDGTTLAASLWRRAHELGLSAALPNLYLRRRLHYTPEDPRYGGQWYFQNLDMPAAWSLTRGSSEVTIVVIDTGCDTSHPDLATKLDAGRDVVSGDDDPSYVPYDPGNEHGTACAGIVGAATDNGVGMAGGCPRCRVRCVRMLGADGESVPLSADVDAFTFAYEVGAAVVSNSWGFVDAIPVPAPLADVIATVADSGRGGRGAVVLFAMGNDDREVGNDELQATYGVLGVGAVNNFDDKTSFTNFGDSVDLVAPVGTVTLDIAGADGREAGDYTTSFGGTSSACPVAAGIAGLIASAAPRMSGHAIADLLIRTTRPAPYALPDENGHDPVFGYGIIDPVAALEEAIGPPEEAGDEDDGCAAAPSPLAALLGMLIVLRRRRG